jgi:putative membrane protein
MMGFYGGWGQWFALCLTMLVVWGLLGLGVVVAVRGSLNRDRGRRSDDPKRILAERFARGELSEDEYFSARSVLDAHEVPEGRH